VLAAELAGDLDTSLLHQLLGDDGLTQVISRRERADAAARIIQHKGGPDGDGLAEARKTLAVLRAEAERINSPDVYCQPISSLLAHTLIRREYLQGIANGEGKALGGQSRGDNFRSSLQWLQTHLKLRIDLDPAVIDSAAPKAKEIAGAGQVKAGTLSPAMMLQLELIAAGLPRSDLPAPDSLLVFYARSILAFGVLCSLRMQDMDEIELVQRDETNPDTVIRGRVRLTKNGEPLELYAPAEGLLGPLSWWPTHLSRVIALGSPFPDYIRPWGSAGQLAASPGFTARGKLAHDRIPDLTKQLLMLAPLRMSAEELKELGIRGHSYHGTFADWATTIGEWPSLFVAQNAGSPYELGFSANDLDLFGNWLSRNQTTEGAANQASPDAGAMRLRYARGHGRSGLRERQLDTRLRLIRIVRCAYDGWTQLHGKSWLHLPRGADAKYILSRHPARVAPID
jgi:hypothetical protein